MQRHFCPEDKNWLDFEGECSWCGITEQRLQMTNELIALYNKLEYMKPPQDSSFDFYIGFMEARRLALRAIKGLD